MSQDTISLQLEAREVTGKAVKHIRRAGQVPAVIHNHGKASIHVQGDYLAMLRVWQHAGKHHPVELKTGDQSFTALIKVAEFDPQKHRLAHVVFNAVDRHQKVEAEIPIHPRYDEGNESSPAERAGLIVLRQLESVQVKAIPTKLPDFLEYDAEKLVDIGDHVTVDQLIKLEGVEILTEPEHAVAMVYEPGALAEANDALAGEAEAEAASEVAAEHEGTAEAGTEADATHPGSKEEKADKS